ncbi:hypothetical protein N7468_009427 [Penicillium chermesinum]|uniref:N-acetyltransferase domain-containing protein n=1 Tax=Penicillium chermesinum TaxID=63820 RepID=A0A9W9NKA7_9EURO|nr:uncharacterized protein N7468_009427 [Penicillium chermesinum]KAJ5220223.1 hypothetical protein N7468_009427 [Penicillium chermesinum]
MSYPNYTLVPVESEDLPVLAQFLHSSKQALSINRLIFLDWPNDKIQMRMYSGAVKGGFEDPSIKNFKAVDNDTKEIIGYIAFAKKAVATKEEIEAQNKNFAEQKTPEGINPPLFTPRIELQRRGIGSSLVKLATDQAKEENIPFTAFAEAPALGFFEKLGMQETRHVDIDLRKYAAPNCGFGPFRLTGMILNP